MSLRQRIAAALACSVFAVGAGAATVAYLSTSAQLRDGIDETLRSNVGTLVETGRQERRGGAERGGELDNDRRLHGDLDCPPAGAFPSASGAQIVAGDGTVTACIEGGLAIPVSSAEGGLANGATTLQTVSVDGDRYRVASIGWGDIGTLQVARTLEETASALDRVRLRLGALVILASLVAATLGWYIASRLVRPIVELRDAAERITSTGDLLTAVDVRTKGEVGDLATSFASMVEALRHSRDQQRRLVADASHEMRTPLTSLRANMHLLGDIERVPAPERREIVGDVIADVDELANLLGELVDLASDMSGTEDVESVDLGDLARTVAARAQRRHGRYVSVEDATAREVRARPRQIERAIANLVDNALKYSAHDAPIDIVVADTSVTVLDRGRGLPTGEEERIFERFYRANETRSEPGTGLGLAIVDEIVRTHRGTVVARARHDGGSEVGFTLPLQ